MECDEGPSSTGNNSGVDKADFPKKKKKKSNTWNEISKESQVMLMQKYLLVGGSSRAFEGSDAKHEVLGKHLNRLGRNKAMAVEIINTFCQGLNIHVIDELRHVLWNHNRPIVKRWIYDQVSQLFEQKLKEGEMIYNESSSLKESLSLKELAMIKRRVRQHSGSSRGSCYNQMTALSSFLSASSLSRSSPTVLLSATKSEKESNGDMSSDCGINDDDDDTDSESESKSESESDGDGDGGGGCSSSDDSSDDENNNSSSNDGDDDESSTKSSRGKRKEDGGKSEPVTQTKPLKASSVIELKPHGSASSVPEQQQQQQQPQQPQQQQPRARHGSISMRNPFVGLYNKHIKGANNQHGLHSGGRPTKERSMSTVTPPLPSVITTTDHKHAESFTTSTPPATSMSPTAGSKKKSLTYKPTVHSFEAMWNSHHSHNHSTGDKQKEEKEGLCESGRKPQAEERFITKIKTKYYRSGSGNPFYIRPKLADNTFFANADAETVVGILRSEEPLRWDDKDAVDYWSSRSPSKEHWESLSRDATQKLCPPITAKALLTGWNIEFSYMSVTHEHPSSEKPVIIGDVDDYPYYREFIAKGPHDNYVAKDGPCIVSVESKPKAGTSCKAIVRTALHTERILLPPENPMKALQKFLPIVKESTFVRIKNPEIINTLIRYDEKQYTKSHKIGILYCKNRVKDENDLFSAKEGSPAYNEFLEFLGEKVRLKGWNKYSGGLDIEGKTKKNNNKNKEIITTITSLHICLDDLTGEYSVYSEFRGHEIMYHVCTILPLKEKDTQRVDRKRHIGNDVVVIVFKDSSDKDDAFDPNIFKSHFICNSLNSPHFSTFVYFCFIIIIFVFVCTDSVFVITPILKEDGTTGHYQISIANKSCVPPYPPFMPKDFIFPKDQAFKDFLLTKRKKNYKNKLFSQQSFFIVINAERTDVNSGEFKTTMNSARNHLLVSIYDTYKP